jgi:hypothetical protein
MKISVPTGNSFFDISRVVRHGIDADGLHHDHRRTPLDNAEEEVVVTWPLKRDLEPEAVAIKPQRGGDTPHDEEWRNAENFRFSRLSLPVSPNVHAEVWTVQLSGTLATSSSVHTGNDALCRPRVLCVGWTERLLKDRLLNANPIADRD